MVLLSRLCRIDLGSLVMTWIGGKALEIFGSLPLRLRTRVYRKLSPYVFGQGYLTSIRESPEHIAFSAIHFHILVFFASAFISNLEEYTILPCHMVRLKLLF